jgi:hypothetical protein
MLRPDSTDQAVRRPSRSQAPRYTSTGILECVSTFWVSLPSKSALTPLRPWEAIMMRSQPFFSTMLMMAS